MAAAGDTVYPTVGQLRAVGEYATSAGLITGLDLDDAAYGYDLHSGEIGPWTLTAASIIETVATYGHVDSDTSLEFRVPGVDATDCVTGFNWTGILFDHRSNVGIYGPGPAQDHTAWAGSGGAATPDADGAFAVTASGTPTLTLSPACNYDTRLGLVPAETAPEGAPTVYLTRKADYYYSTEAVREAVYSWLGWAWLKLSFTAPADCTLTLTLTGRVYTFEDNHLSDSTRQTEFAFTTTDATYTYQVPVTAGAGVYYVCLMAPVEQTFPLLERVVSVSLAGFSDGAWVLSEPLLVIDLQTNGAQSAKTFEADCSEYPMGGGFSARVDCCHEAAYSGDSVNANHAERTIRMFDKVEGAGTGYDLTVARSMDSLVSLIERSSDAWACSVDATAFDTHCKDVDGSYLTNGYAFDIAAPETDALEHGSSDLSCALRCGVWDTETGIRCLVLTDKVIGSRAHGRAIIGTTLRRSRNPLDRLWRREVGTSTWTQVETLTSDAAAYWDSESLSELCRYDDTEHKWYEYGIGRTTAVIVSMGQAYTREYIAARAGYSTGDGIAMTKHPAGLVKYLVGVTDTSIIVKRLDDGVSSWTALPTVDTSGSYDSAAVEHDGTTLTVVARNTDTQALYQWYTQDEGDTWTGPTAV